MQFSALPGHVMVQTLNGYRNIRDVRVNCQILSWNPDTLKEEYTTILSHEKLPVAPVWKICTWNGNKLFLGESQRVFTHDLGYVNMKEIDQQEESAVILISDQEIDTVFDIRKCPHEEELFSITVSDFNSFFANRILVQI